jgi:chemotaxis protein MotB
MRESSRRPMDVDRFSSTFKIPASSWIVSYSDIMTIILTFFILLLSISTIAQTKYELIVQAFTGEKAGNLTEVEQEIKEVIEEQGLSGEVETKLDMDGLKISFSNALLFSSGEATLRDSAYRALNPISSHLFNKLGPQYGIIVEGYTDDVPISNSVFASNWELSTSRAITVRDVIAKAGLDPRRISVQGFADTRAATDVDLTLKSERERLSKQKLEKARTANRRVILRVNTLPPMLLERIHKLGGWQEAAPQKGSVPSQISPVESTLELELPATKKSEDEQK